MLRTSRATAMTVSRFTSKRRAAQLLHKARLTSDVALMPQASSGPTDSESLLLDLQRQSLLSSDSLGALRRLSGYQRPAETFPLVRRAAVLVALFGGRSGDLHCLLSTRAANMRTYVSSPARTRLVAHLCTRRAMLHCREDVWMRAMKPWKLPLGERHSKRLAYLLIRLQCDSTLLSSDHGSCSKAKAA